MKITVKDIATKAGVSQSTVSKVLNNYPSISSSTKEKVMTAVEELGFVPDLIARSMVKSKTGTIGLIVGDIANPFFSETSKEIITKARDNGIDVIIGDTDYKETNIKNSLSTMLARRVDGILVASVERASENIDDLVKDGFPIMLYNRKTDNEKINYVVLDNEKGARIAVEHLIELGHKNISFLSGSKKYSTFHHRFIGYKNMLEKYRIPFHEEYVFEQSDTNQNLENFIENCLELSEPPTAFFAASDQLAIHVMQILYNKGFEVPKDFSVIGFDDISISATPFISLTTVSQNKEKMASIALEKLLQLIDGEISNMLPVHVVLEPELIVRNTTAKVKKK